MKYISFVADAQLAFLISNGIADIIISEDSDLALFGCKKIIFKMDKQGNGMYIRIDDFLNLRWSTTLQPDLCQRKPCSYNVTFLLHNCRSFIRQRVATSMLGKSRLEFRLPKISVYVHHGGMRLP